MKLAARIDDHESKPFVKISEIRGKKPIRGRRTIQSHSMKDQLHPKIHDHTAVVAVIGLGYVGLPLAVAFAEKGFPAGSHKFGMLS